MVLRAALRDVHSSKSTIVAWCWHHKPDTGMIFGFRVPADPFTLSPHHGKIKERGVIGHDRNTQFNQLLKIRRRDFKSVQPVCFLAVLPRYRGCRKVDNGLTAVICPNLNLEAAMIIDRHNRIWNDIHGPYVATS